MESANVLDFATDLDTLTKFIAENKESKAD